jgi:hypothetical protein
LVAAGLLLAGWLIWATLQARDVDLAGDRLGARFAHDLVLGTPDRALILLSGDEPTAAATYVCAVEKLCGERIVLAPGMLSMPWKMAQTRRQHPELAIPWSGGPALARTHELVLVEMRSRPVFVYPDLLKKDPELARSFDVIPDRLLFRIWRRGTDEAGEHAELVAGARGMLENGSGDVASRFPLGPRPSQEVQLDRAYEAAYVNYVRATGTMASEDVPPALVAALEASARRLGAQTQAQGAWWSNSR